MTAIAYLLALAAFGFFASRRIARYLHIFQQDDYNAARFIGWLFRTRAFDRRLSLALVVLDLAAVFIGHGFRLWALIAGAAFVFFSLREPDPRLEAKKKLVMTPRATRIFGATLGLALLGGALVLWAGRTIFWILPVQLLPFFLAAANKALAPVEARIQQKFWDEAHAKLLQVDPAVIGITGSFGKTSTKHILGHVLEMNARTYYTQGSVNTPMGIAREIREKMPFDCKFFLVEMGAYGIGSIERLCKLAPPSIGIITAIGAAHYERYKSLDAVARAKFELAEAVLKKPEGKILVHESALAQDYARNFAAMNPGRFIICGESTSAQFRIENIEQKRDGIALRVVAHGNSYELFTPLFGLQHAGNIALSFAAAVTLGVVPDRVIAALKTVPQIAHRLEVKRQPGAATYIDDAFNSNPQGFTAALELLGFLGEGGRRILVTPGIAELGEKNAEAHRVLGEKAAKLVDIAFVVRSDRIPAFAVAYRAAGGKDLREVASFKEAEAWLKANADASDVVLLENDLPDVLERKLVL